MKLVWELKEISLKLAFQWSISRGSSLQKTNFFILINGVPFGEVAPNKRFNEDGKIVKDQFSIIESSLPRVFHDQSFLNDVLNVINSGEEYLNSLQYGIESAAVNYFCFVKNIHLGDFLNCSTVNSFQTSFSLPILKINEYSSFIEQNKLSRFKIIKVKLSNVNVIETLEEVSRLISTNICVDFNEAYKSFEEFKPVFRQLKNYNLQFVEQPFPSENWKCYQKLVDISDGVDVILDESITSQNLSPKLNNFCHGVNIKLMKSGGILRAVDQFAQARKIGLKILIGCMVETSLSIYNACMLSSFADYLDLDGFMLLDEDPSRKLIETDGRIELVRSEELK